MSRIINPSKDNNQNICKDKQTKKLYPIINVQQVALNTNL